MSHRAKTDKHAAVDLPEAVKLLIAAVHAKIDIDINNLNEALNLLENTSAVVAHIDPALSGSDKKATFQILATKACPEGTNVRVINAAAAAITATLARAMPKPTTVVRAAAKPFLDSLARGRLDVSLREAAAPTAYPNLNERLERSRQRALARIPAEVLDVIRGDTAATEDPVAQYGLRQALCQLLVPILCATLGQHARQTISLGQANDILSGDPEAEDILAVLEQ
jgi:hypothetical protein